MRRSKGRGRTAVVAGSLATALLMTGVVIAGAASSAHADETFTPTCTMVLDVSPTITYNPTLTLGITAPDAAPPGAVITVAVNAHPENLPLTDANPQNLVAYTSIATEYGVAGGTVVPGSEHVTSVPTINTFALPAPTFTDTANSVAAEVAGPIPPGTFVPAAYSFDVLVDPAAASVNFSANQHNETANFDGPGQPELGRATCPISGELASTTVDPNAATTTLASTTSTTATTTSSSTSSSTTPSTVATTTTTQADGGTTTTLGSTTTTIGTPPPPPPFYIGDPTIVEPGPNTQGHLSFTIIRSDSSKRAKVHFRTIDGTAKHKVDYNLRDFSAEFARGKPAITIYVTVKHDPRFTIGRWFTVEISDPKTGAVFGTAIATITAR